MREDYDISARFITGYPCHGFLKPRYVLLMEGDEGRGVKTLNSTKILDSSGESVELVRI